MSCACRTKSFRIFVQSLTELSLVDPAISRSVRLNQLGSPVTFSQATVCHSRKQFSTSSATYSPRQKTRASINGSSLASQMERELSDAPVDAVAEITTFQSSSIPTPPIPPSPISSGNLTAAKHSGAILEYDRASIDSLFADLDRAVVAKKEAKSGVNRKSRGQSAEFGLQLERKSKRKNREQGTRSDFPDEQEAKSAGKPRDREQHAQSDFWAEPREGGDKKPPRIPSSQLAKITKTDKKQGEEYKPEGKSHKPDWLIQKEALKAKFPEGWNPRKKLSPDAREGIRALHKQFPEQYTTPVLAQLFAISPEAIRRILKSDWQPRANEDEKRQQRWFERGKQIWGQMAELGVKPPRRWRQEGVVRQPHWNEKKKPRTEWPYVPHRGPPDAREREPVLSAHRKLSGNLL